MGRRGLRATGRARFGWALLAAGALSWAAAGLVTPGGHVGHLGSYVATVAGLLLVPVRRVRGQALLDAGLVAGSLLVVGWAFVLRPLLSGGTADAPGGAVDAAAVAGYLCAGVAALAPSLRSALLPYAVLLPAAATVLLGLSAGTVDAPLLASAAVVLLLLLARHLGTALDHARLTRRLTAAEALVETGRCTDPLTGLASRARLTDRLAEALPERRVALLCCDLDGFKAVNDSLGPRIGDRLLVEAARRISRCTRPVDTVARLGGDEFGVMVRVGDGDPEVLGLAECVREALAEPYVLGADTVTVSASIGIALSGPADDPATLLRNAALAMYRAKSAGRSGCAAFEPAMHTAAVRRLGLECALRAALDRGELRLAYQPIIDLTTHRLAGAETLVRWDGRDGPVDPLDFVPLAEELGLIVPIGRWILDGACAQLARWRAYGHDPLLTVNVSARQLLDPEFPADVAAALRRHDVPPGHLMLELTETVLIHDGAPAALARLRGLGVRLALDDFGTGWSSLSYLQHLPVDTVKIDRSFVADLGSGGGLTRAVVALGRELDLDLIAEGVERPAQARWLADAGCRLAQGWLFSAAVDGDEVLRMLRAPLVGAAERRVG
jgi:diguanylate cyclase (GGDEF)-like protein